MKFCRKFRSPGENRMLGHEKPLVPPVKKV